VVIIHSWDHPQNSEVRAKPEHRFSIDVLQCSFHPLDRTSSLIVSYGTLRAVDSLLTSSTHPSASIPCHSCSLLLLTFLNHFPPI